MRSLKGKTLFITGASRGIGKAIALRAASDGANIVIAAKTTEPHPSLPGTIHSAAEEIRAAGGQALALQVDIRDPDQVAQAAKDAAAHFGGIDILINNASAINLTGTLETPAKRFDLMMGVNMRGTFLCSQACLPYLKNAENPHILVMSPPITLEPRWFGPHLAYTMSKFGMSMCVLGLAEEWKEKGIAVNALWPKTVIATAALAMLGDAVKTDHCRTTDIVADAAWAVLTRPSRQTTGRFLLDEDVLREEGETDFDKYAVSPGKPLLNDLFL
ncbi:MAG TPA: NAD(P)-dependent oxidoreductase [Candidatus Sulfotelmatobacter sp.]|jgi:citronellol/citronellal dehydrogenase|nr:NAD(P)-dependent oxidoreductase [Candidatus Sulfotelmatobacter sp.]